MDYDKRYENLRGVHGYKAGEVDSDAVSKFLAGAQGYSREERDTMADKMERMLGRGELIGGMTPATIIATIDGLRE